MNKMTSLYILWGVVMCLQLAFIFRDTTHIVGYTLEFINPNDLQELSIPLVVKPDVYEPDTLVNTRTGEVIKVAYGQAVKRAVGDASVWCRMRHAQYAVHCVALSVEQHFL